MSNCDQLSSFKHKLSIFHFSLNFDWSKDLGLELNERFCLINLFAVNHLVKVVFMLGETLSISKISLLHEQMFHEIELSETDARRNELKDFRILLPPADLKESKAPHRDSNLKFYLKVDEMQPRPSFKLEQKSLQMN